MSKEPLGIVSVQDIATQLGVSTDRVKYAIRKAGMEPAGKLSGVRVFFEEDIPAIRDMINKIRKPPPAALRKPKARPNANH